MGGDEGESRTAVTEEAARPVWSGRGSILGDVGAGGGVIAGAVEGLIISVITQPCLLIGGISRRRNRGDVVLVLQETLSGI